MGGAPDGLGWRTRVTFAVDRDGGIGLRRHRSHDIEPVDHCPIATVGVNGADVGSVSWRGARQIEVFASPDGGVPVVLVETGRDRLDGLPDLDVGLVWKGRTLRAPDHVDIEVGGHRFTVGAGVFWQVHPAAGPLLTEAVLEGLDAGPGDRVADLYAGAGLFTVALAGAVGPAGTVVAVERSGPAVADLKRNAAGLRQVEISAGRRHPRPCGTSTGGPRRRRTRPGPGRGRSRRDGGPRRHRSGTASDGLRVVRAGPLRPGPRGWPLDAGWTLRSLRAFDLFPMTEHVELVGILDPPGAWTDRAPDAANAFGDREPRGRWYSRPVRGRPLGLSSLAAGAGSPPAARAGRRSSVRRPPGPRSRPVPSRRRSPCRSAPTRLNRHDLGPGGGRPGVHAHLGRPSLRLHLRLSGRDPPGSFDVSVKELSSWDRDLRLLRRAWPRRWGRRVTSSPSGRRLPDHATARSWCARTGRCSLVDDTGLPPQFGVPPTSSGAVAVTVADVILGCWAGD